jgi:hypothetical protein
MKPVAGGATAGSSRTYRLDPHTLPARSFPSSGVAGPAFVIDRDRAVVRRSAIAGVAMLTVPVAAYRGVAVRMESTGDTGEVCAFIELLHAEPSLTLTLAITDEPYDIEDDWRAWGAALKLPLLVVGQDGSVAAPLAGPYPSIAVAPAKPRRRHSFFAARRPRFLARRKVGRSAAGVRVDGREIIARD